MRLQNVVRWRSCVYINDGGSGGEGDSRNDDIGRYLFRDVFLLPIGDGYKTKGEDLVTAERETAQLHTHTHLREY